MLSYAALIVQHVSIWILVRLKIRIYCQEEGNPPVLPPCVRVRSFQLSFNDSNNWLGMFVGDDLKTVLMSAGEVIDAAE